MANAKHPDQEPEEEVPEPEEITAGDLLEDTDSGEIDLEALLEEGEGTVGDTSGSASESAESAGSPGSEEVEISADDLLDLGEFGEGQVAGDGRTDGGTVRVPAEPPTFYAGLESVEAGPEGVEEFPHEILEDLTQDEPEAGTTQPAMPPKLESPSDPEGRGEWEEVAPAGKEAAESPPAAEGAKPGGKKPFGKTTLGAGKRFGKKEEEAEARPKSAASGRGLRAPPAKFGRKAPREKKKAAPRPVAAGPAKRGSIPFVCSECYEEFLLPNNYSKETVSCPECLHVGKRPDEDFVRTVTLHKAGEQRALATALMAGTGLILVVLFLIWLRSPYDTLKLDTGTLQNTTYGLLGLSALLVALLMWLVARFEGNRWEVYF
jgi:hypothetical protein